MVKYGLKRVQLPLLLQQSLINGFSWYGLSWATVVSKHMYSVLRLRGITKSGGVVHLKSPVFYNKFLTAKIMALCQQFGVDTTDVHWLKMATRLERVTEPYLLQFPGDLPLTSLLLKRTYLALKIIVF